MDDPPHRDHAAARRIAGASWLAAAVFYLGSEGWAASAFSPPYSYARNYISDLGVTRCGMVFDGRAICSPLHALMNADLILQGVLFVAGGVAAAALVPRATGLALLAFATLNGIGNCLVGLVPENAGPLDGALDYHLLGAFLAIAFGNGTAFLSVWAFRRLGLPPIHRRASLGLPLIAGLAIVLLLAARASAIPRFLPDGVLERIGVYAITAWEILSAACLLGRTPAR